MVSGTSSKGELTHQAILDRAAALASQVGLSGVTIGALADDLGLSKSGLFGHFRSKQALELQTLDHAAALFIEHTVRPALKAPRGEPRVRAIFERWLAWGKQLPGGCLFAAAAVELDDRPGPVRERLVQYQRDWLDTIANTVRTAVDEGHFKADTDCEQFAHDLYGVFLACYHAARLLRDPRAEKRARRAFAALIQAVQK
jgi:AcrR family transcriptional regulator